MARTANEVSALLEVAGEAVDQLAISPAQGLHRAVAGRVFGAVGPLSAPVRLDHPLVYERLRSLLAG